MQEDNSINDSLVRQKQPSIVLEKTQQSKQQLFGNKSNKLNISQKDISLHQNKFIAIKNANNAFNVRSDGNPSSYRSTKQLPLTLARSEALSVTYDQYDNVCDYFEEFPGKMVYTLDHLKVFLNRRYNVADELLNNVYKRLSDYENKLKRLESKIAKNTTVKQIILDMERFQQFANILQKDIDGVNIQIKKENHKIQVLKEIKDNKKNSLDVQNATNLEITTEITKLKKALKSYDQHVNNTLSESKIGSGQVKISQDPVLKLENYCGSILKQPKKRYIPENQQSIITKNYRIQLSTSASHTKNPTNTLMSNSKSDFRKTFLRQSYYSKLSQEKQESNRFLSTRQNFNDIGNKQQQSSQKLIFPKTTQDGFKQVNKNQVVKSGSGNKFYQTMSSIKSENKNQLKQQNSVQFNNSQDEDLQQQIKIQDQNQEAQISKNELILGSLNYENEGEKENKSNNLEQIQQNINFINEEIQQQEKQLKQIKDQDNKENKNINNNIDIDDEIIDDNNNIKNENIEQKEKLMNELEQTVDKINEYKDLNKEAKKKLLDQVNYFQNCMGLFEQCFETQIVQLEKNQKRVLNSQQGLQGSLYFEISKTKKTLSEIGFERKLKQYQTNLMSRQIQSCVHDTLKNMLVEKKKKQQLPNQQLQLDWNQFKQFSVIQITGVMTLKPKTFNDIKWLYNKKSKQIKTILDKYRSILNSVENTV